MLDNKHLRSFLRVLDLGGFSRAARSLNIAQPALSQHVRKLEEQLSVTLLDRSAHGVTATPAGRQFAIRARQILELVDVAEREFKSGPEALFGEVTVGLPGSVCPVLATRLIVETRQRFPNIKLVVSELMSGNLADQLRDGRMDMAILFNVTESDDFTSEPVAREALHLVGPPDDPRLAGETIAASALLGLPLVGTRPPHGLRLLIERWINAHDMPLTFAVEADAPTVLVDMAAQGMCYSILSHAAIQEKARSGVLSSAEIVSPPIERKACLCTSKRLPPNPAREEIQKLFHSVVTSVVRRGEWQAELL
ncbi:LysR family transcriptional regulator [Pacificoceanicola onchidii]|uniref:LysR family transcriptional regulator n=1 Tax=Pacificoceanicola onchidii TaxID=2562685 RepID=UPI0010A6559C|nr:LysR family transcriptional regulator [Pacificoceanicola onchidii]